MSPSHLEELREALHEYSKQAKDCADDMEELQKQYRGYQEHVLELIEGSSSGKDREISETIDEAGRSLRESQEALVKSAKDASDYGDEL
jgi:uncharacterized coiled-coil DUF342 family protein